MQRQNDLYFLCNFIIILNQTKDYAIKIAR